MDFKKHLEIFLRNPHKKKEESKVLDWGSLKLGPAPENFNLPENYLYNYGAALNFLERKCDKSWRQNEETGNWEGKYKDCNVILFPPRVPEELSDGSKAFLDEKFMQGNYFPMLKHKGGSQEDFFELLSMLKKEKRALVDFEVPD